MFELIMYIVDALVILWSAWVTRRSIRLRREVCKPWVSSNGISRAICESSAEDEASYMMFSLSGTLLTLPNQGENPVYLPKSWIIV